MLSSSIINTYSTWRNNQNPNQPCLNTYKHPIAIPPKYTTKPTPLGAKNIHTTAPYFKMNSNVFKDQNETDSSDSSDDESEKDSEIEIYEIEESIVQIPPIHPNINLDDYKLTDPVIQFYFGSITVIGLFILFRLMSKPK